MVYKFKRARARKRVQESLRELAKQGRVLPPALGTVPCEYISLPALDIPGLVVEYIAAMETQETDDWCRCEWIIHPDDVDLPKGKRRKRRGDEAWDCPVHTKEGFLIYFFEWVFARDKY